MHHGGGNHSGLAVSVSQADRTRGPREQDAVVQEAQTVGAQVPRADHEAQGVVPLLDAQGCERSERVAVFLTAEELMRRGCVPIEPVKNANELSDIESGRITPDRACALLGCGA